MSSKEQKGTLRTGVTALHGLTTSEPANRGFVRVQHSFCYNLILSMLDKRDTQYAGWNRETKSMKFIIRDYHEADSGACRSLWKELAEHHARIYEDPSIASNDPGQAFESYIANAQRRATWVIEAEDQVVACAGLLLDLYGDGKEAEIEPIIVSASYRRKGIGTKLIHYAVAEARKLGVCVLSIRPVLRNEEAIHFFAREGFNLVGYIDLFQNLSQSSYKKWKPGIVIHGNQLRY